MFLKYFSIPEYKINFDVEKEIINSSNEDYVEVKDTQDLLKIIS